METFSALLAICAGNSPVTGEFPAQRPVTRSFDVFFDLRLNKRLSKQWWCWWFDTLSRPLWRPCNESGSREHIPWDALPLCSRPYMMSMETNHTRTISVLIPVSYRYLFIHCRLCPVEMPANPGYAYREDQQYQAIIMCLSSFVTQEHSVDQNVYWSVMWDTLLFVQPFVIEINAWLSNYIYFFTRFDCSSTPYLQSGLRKPRLK